MKLRALKYLKARAFYHEQKIKALQASANPPMSEIADNREDLAVINELIPVVEALPETEAEKGVREKDVEIAERDVRSGRTKESDLPTHVQTVIEERKKAQKK